MTRDHVVPRSRLEYRFRQDPALVSKAKVSNIVACCTPCNQVKADHRSTCDCGLCILAWQTFGPEGWASWPQVDPTRWQDLGVPAARGLYAPHAYGPG